MMFFASAGSLLMSPGLPQRPALVTEDEMTKFHADDYVRFLQMITVRSSRFCCCHARLIGVSSRSLTT